MSADSIPVIVLAGGGTGGHLMPGIAVAQALDRLTRTPPGEPYRVVMAVTGRPIDRIVQDHWQIDTLVQPVQPLVKSPVGLLRFVRGWWGSMAMCGRFCDTHTVAAVLGTGGYASLPMLRTAWKRGIPTAMLNPDAIPGRANRHALVQCRRVYAQWPVTADHADAGDRMLVCGCPVRDEVRTADRGAGYAHFGLDAHRKTLLITGASQGAANINNAVIAVLDLLDAHADTWQILHVAGPDKLEAVRAAYETANLSIPYSLVGFTDQMPLAIAVADLAVSRAGASSLAECTALGTPSILLPYPYHRDQHQLANARVLEAAGAAWIVTDTCDTTSTAAALRTLLTDLLTDTDRLTGAADAAAQLARVDAADVVAGDLLTLCRPT